MNMVKLGCEKMFYGKDAVEGIECLQGPRKKAFIVMSGDILAKLGTLDIVTKQLDKAGFTWETYCDVEPEPSFQSIKKGAEKMKKFEPDWIIGFGGGSAMDAAKAMWVFYENEDYKTLEDAIPSEGIAKLKVKAHVCCIPTSAGTGSEATRAALIKDTVKKKKYSIRDMNGRLIPDVAILDPVFTATMPKSLIAASGMDSMTHAIESYVSPIANPFSSALALGAFLYGYKNLTDVYTNNAEIERIEMLAVACMGGIAFSNSALGIVHSIAHSFGAEYGIPHGLANAIILPYGIAFNEKDEKVALKYNELAYFIKEKSLLEAIKKLNETLSIPISMKELITDETMFIENLNSLCEKAMSDVCTQFTPVKPSFEEMRALILQVYNG